MKNRISRGAVYDAAVVTALLAAAVSLVIYTGESVQAARYGLDLCANVIVPSLFPFFVLSSLMVDTGAARYIGRPLGRVMGPLFNVGGQCAAAVVLGFIGGYPVGARTVIKLYENGECSKAEAERLLSFCNNSGPAFIFGVVGAGVFSSGAIGLMLYMVHTAASLAVGVIFSNWKRGDDGSVRGGGERTRGGEGFLPLFVSSVKSAAASSLNICGFVIFFTVFIRMLNITGVIPAAAALLGDALGPLGFDSEWGKRLITGALELSSGVWSLKDAATQLTGTVAMAAFMLGWAGLSVHSQVLSFIGTSGLSARTYILGKLLQGGLSAVMAAALGRLFAAASPAPALALGLAEQVSAMASRRFTGAGAISLVCSAALFAAALPAMLRGRGN
jgi:sporulation integral membrane protein YlbJ